MAHETRPRTLDPDNLAPLEAWLSTKLDAGNVHITSAKLLAGGAIGENWKLRAKIGGGAKAGVHEWVLRTDAHSRNAMSHDRAQEFACLAAAYRAGVAVPEPIAESGDASLIGAPFMIVGFAPGVAQGRVLVRDPAIETKGEALAGRLGVELAKLHSVRPPRSDLAFLSEPPRSPALQQVQAMRNHLDAVAEPRPALEYALVWLEANAPSSDAIVLCHGDFRTGNYLAEGAELTAILDWEFCHWGDRHEDVGWFCARCWRFGRDDREAGGIGSRAAFYRGYNETADTPLDPEVVPYWEIWAAARWALVALLQGERHVSGRESSLELLLTGLMAPEMEYDAIAGIIAQDARR
jgi:aminoglycoside phosphotransferase (APT) family kinase protein